MDVTSTPLQTDLAVQLLTQFIAHPGIVGILILLFLVWIYGGKLIEFVKDYISKKMDNEAKRVDEIKELNDKHFTLYENQTKIIEGTTTALTDLKEVLLVFKGDIINAIQASELRVSDKIVSSSHNVIHQSKLDKIAASLGGGEEDNGNPG